MARRLGDGRGSHIWSTSRIADFENVAEASEKPTW